MLFLSVLIYTFFWVHLLICKNKNLAKIYTYLVHDYNMVIIIVHEQNVEIS